MTAREPATQIVRTDAGYHVRIIGGNGEPIVSSEVHPRLADAIDALAVIAQALETSAIVRVDERTPTPRTGASS